MKFHTWLLPPSEGEKVKIILAAFVVVACSLMWAYAPGGPANRHRWFSDIMNEGYAARKVEYDKCIARKSDEEITLCISPNHYAAIELNYINESAPFQSVCWEIDFCIRHGESRVLPCQREIK